MSDNYATLSVIVALITLTAAIAIFAIGRDHPPLDRGQYARAIAVLAVLGGAVILALVSLYRYWMPSTGGAVIEVGLFTIGLGVFFRFVRVTLGRLADTRLDRRWAWLLLLPGVGIALAVPLLLTGGRDDRIAL